MQINVERQTKFPFKHTYTKNRMRFCLDQHCNRHRHRCKYLFWPHFICVDAYQLYLHLFVIIDCMRSTYATDSVHSHQIYNRFKFEIRQNQRIKNRKSNKVLIEIPMSCFELRSAVFHGFSYNLEFVRVEFMTRVFLCTFVFSDICDAIGGEMCIMHIFVCEGGVCVCKVRQSYDNKTRLSLGVQYNKHEDVWVVFISKSSIVQTMNALFSAFFSYVCVLILVLLLRFYRSIWVCVFFRLDVRDACILIDLNE